MNPYENLCWNDPRNPNYIPPLDDDDVRIPRNGCTCDNCFYGKDVMALEIIRLRMALQTPEERIAIETSSA
jgi:hypothetical protein